MTNNLKRILDERGMTYMDLTLKTGLDPAHISKIVKDNKGVHVETALKIAKALDMKVEEIFVPESEKVQQQ